MNPISKPKSNTVERQLELTVIAYARSLRKLVRSAEREDPTGTTAVWLVVQDRTESFEKLLKSIGEFSAATRPPEPAAAPETPAAAPPAEQPAPTQAEEVLASRPNLDLDRPASKLPVQVNSRPSPPPGAVGPGAEYERHREAA